MPPTVFDEYQMSNTQNVPIFQIWTNQIKVLRFHQRLQWIIQIAELSWPMLKQQKLRSTNSHCSCLSNKENTTYQHMLTTKKKTKKKRNWNRSRQSLYCSNWDLVMQEQDKSWAVTSDTLNKNQEANILNNASELLNIKKGKYNLVLWVARTPKWIYFSYFLKLKNTKQPLYIKYTKH